MASDMRLDHIVKGAPRRNVQPTPPAPIPELAKLSTSEKYTPDPHLSTLPSSPPQIYLNLLIFESSLRAQFLHLVARRRLNTFFLTLLGLWNGFFFYALFLRPREDGIGLGGSVYWMVETSEKLAMMGGVVTVLLVWGTGQWERGVRWPRKWLGTTNRGLRSFNLRVVVIRGRFWREMLGHLSFLLPFGLWREAGGSDWHWVEHENGTVVEEDLAAGGDSIMLLLLPKSFSPEFRESWEEYRSEYWEKENDRRAGLRRKLKLQRRAKAKEAGGWKWWTGAWQLASHRHHHHHRRNHDLEKHPSANSSRHMSLSEKDALARHPTAGIGRRRTGLDSDSTHSRSRQSSRSSTPQLDLDGSSELAQSERVRRGSSVSSTASARRKTQTRDRKDRDSSTGPLGHGAPLGLGVGLTPLTSTTSPSVDEREERRRRRREREALREKKPGETGKRAAASAAQRQGEKDVDLDQDGASSGASAPTTPRLGPFTDGTSVKIKLEPAPA